MAHFRGTIQGQRGSASRLGSARSGLTINANGWDFGVKVILREKDGQDVADIFLTGGSHDAAIPVYVGSHTVASLNPYPAAKV
jgi:hypothetical protein